jgi:hypothetical protein
MEYYTYAYLREDRTLYYIGKGKGNRAYNQHKRKGKGFLPIPPKNRIIFLKQNLTEEQAFRHEKYMIAVFGRKDLGTGILLNLSNGGEGPSGAIPWNINKSHQLETIEKIRKKAIGRIMSKNARLQMSKSHIGKRHPEEVKKKYHKSNWVKIIIIISMTGNLLLKVVKLSLHQVCQVGVKTMDTIRQH